MAIDRLGDWGAVSYRRVRVVFRRTQDIAIATPFKSWLTELCARSLAHHLAERKNIMTAIVDGCDIVGNADTACHPPAA